MSTFAIWFSQEANDTTMSCCRFKADLITFYQNTIWKFYVALQWLEFWWPVYCSGLWWKEDTQIRSMPVLKTSSVDGKQGNWQLFPHVMILHRWEYRGRLSARGPSQMQFVSPSTPHFRTSHLDTLFQKPLSLKASWLSISKGLCF